MNQASFWLGGLQRFEGRGSYQIQLKQDSNDRDAVIANFRGMDLTWRWIDEIDAHGLEDYGQIRAEFAADSFWKALAKETVEILFGDIIGDKALNANYWAHVNFSEKGVGGTFKYNVRTKMGGSFGVEE